MNHRELFLRYNAQTSDAPLLLEFVKAKGVYMYDSEGNAYLDAISGIGVSNVGHCHADVVQAVQEQAAKFMHLMVYGEYVQQPQVLFAKALCEILPETLNSVYFVNSGSEATEGAMKLAKRATGRRKIVACEHAYHGSTHGALSVMGSSYFKQGYEPLLPEIVFVKFNSLADLEHIDEDTAAIILEPVQGEAGVVVADEGYLKAVKMRCEAVGALLILDEIQTGFGRTGKLFAFENEGITPDILLLAKGIGGGMPIGAFVANKSLMDCFSNQPVLGHITTFGGHPVSCAAGLATLKVLQNEQLVEKLAEKSALLRSLLVHPKIKEIRCKGLMMALQFEDYAQNKRIIDRCIELGVITDWFLHCDSALRLAPPLVITEDELRKIAKVILQAVEEVG